jgi:hypothetical protein
VASVDVGVRIAHQYSDGLQDGQGLIPSRGKIFLFSTTSRPTLGPTQPLIQWVQWALSVGVKQGRHEADHSPPSCSVVKNGGAIHPLPHMSSLHNA